MQNGILFVILTAFTYSKLFMNLPIIDKFYAESVLKLYKKGSGFDFSEKVLPSHIKRYLHNIIIGFWPKAAL